MDVLLRQLFNRLIFSYHRHPAFRAKIASLREVDRLAVLSNTEALVRFYSSGRKVIPPSELEQYLSAIHSERIGLMLVIEREFGDGHYDQRKELLDTLLSRLATSKKVRLPDVFLALDRATRTQQREQMVGRYLDEQRESKTETDRVVRNLAEWLPRAKSLMESVDIDAEVRPESRRSTDPAHNQENEQTWTRAEHIEVRQALEVIERFLAHIRDAETSTERLRRSRAGRPSAPWVHQARQALRAAGVTSKELREDLLMATGLIPFRSS